MSAPDIAFEHETAFQLLLRLKPDELFLNSKLAALNPILALLPGRCYEIDGDIGVGKTQICYSLVAKFFETKKTAKIGWISAIPMRTDHFSLHLSAQNEHEMERIVCKRAENIKELCGALDRLAELMNVQLIVVEDVDALLHDTVYERESGRQTQTAVAEKLRKLTRNGATVVITNHITHWRGFPAPALGIHWESQIAHRIYVEKLEDRPDVREISTLKQGSTEPIRMQFRIGSRGLERAN
ncbi:unnamed protein product [Caenorhabditis sp. 36 PRJEB53466]|nr:unnamed protein product [Caenorhabditis sp. 36 PRJEB53466]